MPVHEPAKRLLPRCREDPWGGKRNFRENEVHLGTADVALFAPPRRFGGRFLSRAAEVARRMLKRDRILVLIYAVMIHGVEVEKGY